MSSPPSGSQGSQMPERRRHPRHQPRGDVAINLPATHNAEVVDIGSGGTLISTPAHLVPGQRGQLRTLLEREPFSAIVEVQRVELGTRDGLERRNHVGLSFLSLDDNSRRTLQRFVRGARSR